MRTRALWISVLGFGLAYLSFLAFGLGFLWGVGVGIVFAHIVFRAQFGYWWKWD
jgi:hypothetical protein